MATGARDIGRDTLTDTVVMLQVTDPAFWGSTVDPRATTLLSYLSFIMSQTHHSRTRCTARHEFREPWIRRVAELISAYEKRLPPAVSMVATITKNFEEKMGNNLPKHFDWEDLAKSKLAEMRRWAEPSQLADSVEHLKWCVARLERIFGKDHAKQDSYLLVMLGVVLYKKGGADEDALKYLKRSLIFTNEDAALEPKNRIWAHSYLSRVNRRLGKEKEALKAEESAVKDVKKIGGTQGRRQLLPYLLDDGGQTNSIVERIGLNWFHERMETWLPDGSLVTMGEDGRVVIARSAFKIEEAKKMGHVEVFKSGKMCFIADCQKTENLKRCTKCHKALYCSDDHFKLAWKNGHKSLNCDLWRTI